jgi:signal peptide peptidase SppA
MNSLNAYQNSIWLADSERFQRYIAAAIAKPCPTPAQVRERHKELMQLAKDLPGLALQGDDLMDLDETAIQTAFYAGLPAPAISGVRAEAPRAIRATKGKVGVIPIYGPVAQRMTSEMEKAGGTPLDFVSAALDALLGNASVGAIVLRIDSPGGSVDGVQELADKIFAARAEKPIYAIADSCAASAALWLASAATMFISTPAGGGYTVGSCGVYVLHVDESEALEKEGLKVTFISAGKYKTEMNSYGAPSEEAIAAVETMVAGIYDNFVGALARNRGDTPANVRANYGQGRMLTAEKALAVGMIDRVMSYETLIAKLTGDSGAMGSSSGRAMNAKMEQLRRRAAFNR